METEEVDACCADDLRSSDLLHRAFLEPTGADSRISIL